MLTHDILFSRSRANECKKIYFELCLLCDAAPRPDFLTAGAGLFAVVFFDALVLLLTALLLVFFAAGAGLADVFFALLLFTEVFVLEGLAEVLGETGDADFDAPDFAFAGRAADVFLAVDFADDVFGFAVFEAAELFDAPFPPMPGVRERVGFVLAFAVDIDSAAAPTAPIAAPVAAPPKISPATSITLSMIFLVVDVLRPEFFDAPFFDLCVVDLTGMIFSL
jgi:hypothetical protein